MKRLLVLGVVLAGVASGTAQGAVTIDRGERLTVVCGRDSFRLADFTAATKERWPAGRGPDRRAFAFGHTEEDAMSPGLWHRITEGFVIVRTLSARRVRLVVRGLDVTWRGC